jgi:saccharopine dehydrogenase (NAD+, L-lysine-forming)
MIVLIGRGEVMRDAILVIGEYGHVGSKICTTLARHYPGKVMVGGRRLEQAEAFCRQFEGQVRPVRIDIHEEFKPEVLVQVNLVIMCLDQINTQFVDQCLQQGIHYLDISADYSFLSQVGLLHETAVMNRATAVLSVGLAPGLSNLLALYAGIHDNL